MTTGGARRRLAAARDGLRALWRRAVYCRRGKHREAIHPDPVILSWRCVDCGLQRAIGFVFHADNILHPHWPWESES